jgi:two-component system LytT family sensor kinase
MQTGTFNKSSNSEQPSINIWRHLIFIFAFIFFEKIAVFILRPDAPIVPSLLYYIPALGVFYFNTFIIMKLWNRTLSRLLIMVFLVLLEIGFYWGASLIITSTIKNLSISDHKVFNKENNVGNIWRGIYFAGFSLMYWLHLQNIKSNRRADQLALANAEAELEKVRLENKLLRSQINSHFLCNTLNSIYAMAEGRDVNIARALKLTSDFVRYSYTDVSQANVQLVPLSEEIEQINGLLEICSIRFGKLPIQFDIKIEKDSDIKIPPILLLTFVENIFAHGLFTDSSHPVTISIDLTQNEFRFRTRNMKHDLTTHRSTGIGIENAKARLNTYFPQRHRLQTFITDNYYSLDLKITL